MRLRIHHGASEIGGNCVELESAGQSLLIDLGTPLDGPPILPDVDGLAGADARLLGVVLSHPHLDHYGLLPDASANLPVWLGRGAKTLLEAAAAFTVGAIIPQSVTPYDAGPPFEIGPFTITAFLMDHSAFDSHALLIEAEGKRVFYSGDFRGHGRKSYAFERFIADPPGHIDVMLMEGTTIGRTGPSTTEQGVEEEALALMKATTGVVLPCFSGQNIDRFVTFYRASVRAGRTFVIDAYMANLIAALGLPSLPDTTTNPHIRVFLPRTQKRMIATSKRFDLIDKFRARRIFRDELTATPSQFAVMFRASMIPDIDVAALSSATLIYSLWPGYLERDRTDLWAWASKHNVAFQIVHSSGHATEGDLARMAAAVAPRRLLPIHTAHPGRYDAMFDHVLPTANREWVEV